MPVQRDIPDILNFMIAKDALTEIPATPIPGIAYRNASLSAADFEAGQKYSNVYESSLYNQQNYLLSAYGSMVGKYGVLPFQIGQPYAESGRCIGPDGKLYRALQDIAADTSPFPVPGQAGSEDYWAVDIPQNIALNFFDTYTANTIYVDYGAATSGDGTSYDTAFKTVQEAITLIRQKYAHPIQLYSVSGQDQHIIYVRIKGLDSGTATESFTVGINNLTLFFVIDTSGPIEWTFTDLSIWRSCFLSIMGGNATGNLKINIPSGGGFYLTNSVLQISNINLTTVRAPNATGSIVTLLSGINSLVSVAVNASWLFADMNIGLYSSRFEVYGTLTQTSWASNNINCLIFLCSYVELAGSIALNSNIPNNSLFGLFVCSTYFYATGNAVFAPGNISCLSSVLNFGLQTTELKIGYNSGSVQPGYGIACSFCGSVLTYNSPTSGAVVPTTKGLIDFNSQVNTGGLVAQNAWPGAAAWIVRTEHGAMYV